MSPTPGGRVGPYEILSPLGQGGMGEVWKARDSRLDRTVAIKFCRHEFEDRFEREAHAVAALNHPHICTVHDVGPGYMVMEYLNGSPLRCPLPFQKAIEYATQILDALEAAHRHGIIHRDLKPANIFVTKEGIKLLDFGLAKQGTGVAERDATVSRAVTSEGYIAGTLQYMSPEQLEGKAVDARSDLFSFGCVFYEMLTGKRAFDGASPASVIAAILDREPAPTHEQPPLERILRTCLAKDPDHRFQSAADLRLCLQWATETPLESAPLKRLSRLAVALGVSGLAAGLALGWLVSRTEQNRGLPPSRNIRLTHDGQSFTPALSPDGRLVAYASGRAGGGDLDIFVQQLSGEGTVRLTSHPARDFQPAFSADGTKIFFSSLREPVGVYEAPVLGGDARLVVPNGVSPSVSPDGKWLACLIGGKVLVRPITGGEGRIVSQARFNEIRAVWSPDSQRLAVMLPGDAGLGLVPIDGSPADRVPFLQNLRQRGMFEQSYSQIQGWTPKGEFFFSTIFGDAVNIWRIPVRDAGSATPEPVTLGSFELLPVIDVRAGRMVYTANNSIQLLWSLPADLDSGKVLGPLRQFPTAKANAYHQDVTADGRLLTYASRKGGANGIWLMDVASGRERLLHQASDESSSYAHLKFSPDGTRIAATLSGNIGPERTPVWQIVLLDVSTGDWRTLTKRGGRIRGWSRDGRYLVVWSASAPTLISTVDTQTGEFVPILKSEKGATAQPRLSPDGRWIAFLSGSALCVAPFRGNQPLEEAVWTRVAEPADLPFWSPDGRNLYYVTSRKSGADAAALMRQPFDPVAGKPAGSAVLFQSLEGRTLGNSIVNQMIGTRGMVVLGLKDTVSDIWAVDLPDQR